jgi:hypothetical protein
MLLILLSRGGGDVTGATWTFHTVSWDMVGWLTGSSWFGSWYAIGAKPVCMLLDFVTGGMLVSSVGFDYR